MVLKSAKQTKAGQNQNWDFHRHVSNAIFLLTRHSSVFQIIPWNWKHLTNRKVQRGRKSFDTWCYIVTCAMLCVSFSSKSKAINVFPKHILESKAHEQSIQASKKLFYHVIVRNYLCNVSWQFLVKSKARGGAKSKNRHPSWFTVPWQDCQKQPPEVLYKKAILKNFAISTRNTCAGVHFLKSCRTCFRPATLLKRDPHTGVLQWIFQNF